MKESMYLDEKLLEENYLVQLKWRWKTLEYSRWWKNFAYTNVDFMNCDNNNNSKKYILYR